MRNIDEKTFDSLLERIEALKNGISLLEDQIRSLTVVEDLPAPETAEEPEPVDASEQPSGPGRVDPPFASTEYGLSPEAAPVAEDVAPAEEIVPAEAVEEPEPVAEEEPIDITPEDDTPIDISISDVEDIPVEAFQSSEPVAETRQVAEPVIRPVGHSILDTAKADTAVMDVMAEKQAWRTDRPGMPVKNIISAISLNDRVLLINTLFGEDPMLFQETIAKFNAMGSLSEALAYIEENHSDWDMNSEPVYRFMMAVRRKLN